MDKVAALAIEYSAHPEAVKQFWAMKDPAIRQNHIDLIAQPLLAIENGNADLVIKSLRKSGAARPASITAIRNWLMATGDTKELIEEIEAAPLPL